MSVLLTCEYIEDLAMGSLGMIPPPLVCRLGDVCQTVLDLLKIFDWQLRELQSILFISSGNSSTT